MPSLALAHIMLIEDDPDIQMVGRLALESVGGFRVTVCSSGEEGLAAAPVARPDLILLDVMMPLLDGPATLARLREIPDLSRTPVIFMTAKVQSHEVSSYLSQGAIAVIPKPFDPMALAATIAGIWEQYHA
jgi:two-component system, OmpR family, response regulator